MQGSQILQILQIICTTCTSVFAVFAFTMLTHQLRKTLEKLALFLHVPLAANSPTTGVSAFKPALRVSALRTRHPAHRQHACPAMPPPPRSCATIGTRSDSDQHPAHERRCDAARVLWPMLMCARQQLTWYVRAELCRGARRRLAVEGGDARVLYTILELNSRLDGRLRERGRQGSGYRDM